MHEQVHFLQRRVAEHRFIVKGENKWKTGNLLCLSRSDLRNNFLDIKTIIYNRTHCVNKIKYLKI